MNFNVLVRRQRTDTAFLQLRASNERQAEETAHAIAQDEGADVDWKVNDEEIRIVEVTPTEGRIV